MTSFVVVPKENRHNFLSLFCENVVSMSIRNVGYCYFGRSDIYKRFQFNQFIGAFALKWSFKFNKWIHKIYVKV